MKTYYMLEMVGVCQMLVDFGQKEHFNGLLKLDSETLTTQYIKTNSGLETIFATDLPNENIRVEQSAFDKKGNLWTTNSIIKSPLKVLLTNGQWQSFNMEAVVDDIFDSRFSKLLIDKNSTKWLVARSDGLIGFNENYNNKFKKIPIQHYN